MRPSSLDEFEEQENIVGPGTPLRRSIEADLLQSVILYGPPGTGKTTLARIIADKTNSYFESINAVVAGVSDIRRIVQEARDRRSFYSRKTILFIDEIHRFNKAQQDALLPFVEDGLITLIGSTTENPMFSINRPLLSRSRIYKLNTLSRQAILRIINRALRDREQGLGNYSVCIQEQALDFWADIANGDARTALNYLESAVLTTPPGQDGKRNITLGVAEEVAQKRVLNYSRRDEHYDVVSAWIKSMRGSDPQAAVYWLARLLYAGEDPAFLSRRLMIHAAEDVGLADPQALTLAVSAAQAVERVGMPEARIILAEVSIYIANAPKSNSAYVAIANAMESVANEKSFEVPLHLRDASYKGAKSMGHGVGYKYPHDYPGSWVEQEYLPEQISKKVFYSPLDNDRKK
ncbi:MAG: replication-associated recombination protein A [Firmicutes bacterium]|nr:replication-associated recombination protein A [Bacillota bacterium]